jgi:hypothetical protein
MLLLLAWNHYCAKNNASGLNQVDRLETKKCVGHQLDFASTKTQIFEPTSVLKLPIQ